MTDKIMGIQYVADKLWKKYGGPKGPGFNLDSLADNMAGWTNYSYSDSLAALKISAYRT